jgi:hypothetical protein
MAGESSRKRPEHRAMKTVSSSQKKSSKLKPSNQAQLLLGDL